MQGYEEGKNPFLIFGLNADTATQQDVKDAYEREKAKYQEDVFKEGEVGAEAARKISILRQAYTEAMDILESRVKIESSEDMIQKISDDIKQGKFDEAQSKLDAIPSRSAEWHYLQAVVYYKRGWHIEAEKQLNDAIMMDPNNQKYKEALNRLHAVMGKNQGYQQDTQFSRSYQRPTNNDNFGSAMNCCSNLICMDCCCECMGFDLIRCC